MKVVAENNLSDAFPGQHQIFSPDALRLPRMSHHDTIIASVPRRTYANAHQYHVNSISVSSDGETYISADDLRINLWNLGIQDQSFNIIDIKPVNMEELTEVITAAEFHPSHCNQFIYSSSKGTIKLVDMRESALCDNHSKCKYIYCYDFAVLIISVFEFDEDMVNKFFFSEIIASISDVRYSRDGRYILSRDYLTLKIWDVNMEKMPVKTINMHDALQSKLADLYENDCIFDKFECTFSGDGKSVLSGSYSNNFMIYSTDPEEDPNENAVLLQADKSAFKAKKGSDRKLKPGRGISPAPRNGIPVLDPDKMDYSKKILHSSWHPEENSIAIAATNNLFVFSTL